MVAMYKRDNFRINPAKLSIAKRTNLPSSNIYVEVEEEKSLLKSIKRRRTNVLKQILRPVSVVKRISKDKIG